MEREVSSFGGELKCNQSTQVLSSTGNENNLSLERHIEVWESTSLGSG